MARLLPGQDPKIDNINRLVRIACGDDAKLSGEALESLLVIFHPLILKLCKKWSEYFDDHSHNMIRWNIIIADAQFWFVQYTTTKYDVDGSATYNKFIKDHLDQRIRYIFESELNYISKLIFPDPSKIKYDDSGGNNPFEDVVYNYCTNPDRENDTADTVISDDYEQRKADLVTLILLRLGDTRYFTVRESIIFRSCTINGRTHEEVGKELGISRTRVSQIVGKVRERMKEIMMQEKLWWEVYE